MTDSQLKNKLDVILSTLQVYYNNIHALHWSVKAPDFISLHNYLDELYECTGTHIDMIAEFARIYNMHPINTLKGYLSKSLIQEISVAQSQDRTKGLAKMIADTTVMNKVSVDCFKKTEAYPDINDYAAVMVADFGKRIWFMKSMEK